MVHRTTDLFFVLKFKHRDFCGRFTPESHDTSHATPATSTREPTHPLVSACSKNKKIVSYHRVRGCRAYGLLPLWLLMPSEYKLMYIKSPAQHFVQQFSISTKLSHKISLPVELSFLSKSRRLDARKIYFTPVI